MKIVSFKEFIKDYMGYYNAKNNNFSIRTNEEMQEIMYDIYDTDNFEINYDNKTIEMY
jgi:hypothetical protein